MADLSHWDITDVFGVHEATALIAGIDPANIGVNDNWKITMPINRRMEVGFQLALKSNSEPAALKCIMMEDGQSVDGNGVEFNEQRFSRNELARWLISIGKKSSYQFELRRSLDETPTVVQTEQDLDPSDLPIELDAANMAYRAVLNGYGNQSDTFKNRLTDYLKTNFTDLTTEAVQRIATVANPDKTTGRKKRDKE